MPPRSDKYHLLDRCLPGGIETFVAERRDRGISWERIARDIYVIADWEVSHASLSRWFADDEPETAA